MLFFFGREAPVDEMGKLVEGVGFFGLFFGEAYELYRFFRR